ncbi:hypothetical protein E2C01_015181 [Portunus trituberculatus]|uniref:Uncharacterized protein n=1 Tax=Portunus trituberculatus TaxID=210409 RepID=A0A5B7DM97_PORTR|nr:hypothetical protein [Portunus trituberculatus]
MNLALNNTSVVWAYLSSGGGGGGSGESLAAKKHAGVEETSAMPSNGRCYLARRRPLPVCRPPLGIIVRQVRAVQAELSVASAIRSTFLV